MSESCRSPMSEPCWSPMSKPYRSPMSEPCWSPMSEPLSVTYVWTLLVTYVWTLLVTYVWTLLVTYVRTFVCRLWTFVVFWCMNLRCSHIAEPSFLVYVWTCVGRLCLNIRWSCDSSKKNYVWTFIVCLWMDLVDRLYLILWWSSFPEHFLVTYVSAFIKCLYLYLCLSPMAEPFWSYICLRWSQISEPSYTSHFHEFPDLVYRKVYLVTVTCILHVLPVLSDVYFLLTIFLFVSSVTFVNIYIKSERYETHRWNKPVRDI